MLLSEFVNALYKYSDDTLKKADYFVSLFDILMNISNETDNPFFDLQPDTLERYFNGKKIAKSKARQARGKADIHNFAMHINSLSDTNQIAIEDEFKKAIPNFNQDENLGYACADLFLKILDEIYDGTSVSSNEAPPTVNSFTKEQSKKTSRLKLLYKSTDLSVSEQLLLKDSDAVISVNDHPEQFSPHNSADVIYKYKGELQFKSVYAPDRSRKTLVSVVINGITFAGFTSGENWESRSAMNNIIYAGVRTCTAWFYVVSANAQNPVVQFLMIGDTYE